MEAEVAQICHKAVDWFGSQGAHVAEACPDLSDAEEIFQALCLILIQTNHTITVINLLSASITELGHSSKNAVKVLQ